MIIFLYGSDAYRLKKGKLDIINEYNKKHPSGINLFHCNFSEPNDIDTLEGLIKSSSFFNEHKLAVVSGVFAKKFIADKVMDLLKNHNLPTIQDTTLLLAETGSAKELGQKHKELFKLLTDSKGMVKIFEPLEGAELSGWIKSEFKSRNCTISGATISKLIDYVGNDGWMLINEIEKLTAFKKAGEIGSEDIVRLISLNDDSNIFGLTDAIASNNRLRSSELLYRELANGHDPYYLFTIIIGQFRNMITIKALTETGLSQSAIAQRANLHPYVVKKASQNLSKFSMDDLKSKYKTLLGIDLKSKSGQSNLTDSLFRFLLAQEHN